MSDDDLMSGDYSCGKCSGRGYNLESCSDCGGDGVKVNWPSLALYGAAAYFGGASGVAARFARDCSYSSGPAKAAFKECTTCSGSGRERKSCSYCSGRGYVSS